MEEKGGRGKEGKGMIRERGQGGKEGKREVKEKRIVEEGEGKKGGRKGFFKNGSVGKEIKLVATLYTPVHNSILTRINWQRADTFKGGKIPESSC